MWNTYTSNCVSYFIFSVECHCSRAHLFLSVNRRYKEEIKQSSIVWFDINYYINDESKRKTEKKENKCTRMWHCRQSVVFYGSHRKYIYFLKTALKGNNKTPFILLQWNVDPLLIICRTQNILLRYWIFFLLLSLYLSRYQIDIISRCKK